MVTELAPVPDSAAVALNFTTNGVGAPCDRVAGEATTPATAFVGVPITYVAVTTSALAGGMSAQRPAATKAARSASVLAIDLTARRRRRHRRGRRALLWHLVSSLQAG